MTDTPPRPAAVPSQVRPRGRLSPGSVPRQLDRVPLDGQDMKAIDLVMHEYDAIRAEITTALGAQVSVLSFGAATTGLLVAAAGALWADEGLLSGLLLLTVVPAGCFLTLVIHAGELVRLTRAGLFLHVLETQINNAYRTSNAVRGSVLVWEHWDIRHGSADVDRHNRRAISGVFALLAYGFMFAGAWRLSDLSEHAVVPARWAFTACVLLSSLAIYWVWRLYKYAYAFRAEYETG
ncbi:hypothetical protein [Nonomuraea sp. NPDC002799]